MLHCIACSRQVNNAAALGKQHRDQEEDDEVAAPIKNLTSQIKEMALKASDSYKSCKPCSGRSKNRNHAGWDDDSSTSARFHYVYKRADSTPRIWGKEMEARLKGLSSGERTPVSVSGRTDSVVLPEDNEPKEWVAQVEPGVLITFVSLPEGGNDLKRIQFSRELFNKLQAQKWWTENHDKITELYNVQRSVPLPTPPKAEDEVRLRKGSKIVSAEHKPATLPTGKEILPQNLHCSMGVGYYQSDSCNHKKLKASSSGLHGLVSNPKLSDVSAAKMETSSIDASARSSSSDNTGELSVSNASEMETEWVEQDEPGVFITIRALADGTRELQRVKFSRERFEEMDARIWWEENKARIQEQYL